MVKEGVEELRLFGVEVVALHEADAIDLCLHRIYLKTVYSIQ